MVDFWGVCSTEEVDEAAEKEDLLELLFSSFEDEELSSKIRSCLRFFAGVSLSCLYRFPSFSGSLD